MLTTIACNVYGARLGVDGFNGLRFQSFRYVGGKMVRKLNNTAVGAIVQRELKLSAGLALAILTNTGYCASSAPLTTSRDASK